MWINELFVAIKKAADDDKYIKHKPGFVAIIYGIAEVSRVEESAGRFPRKVARRKNDGYIYVFVFVYAEDILLGLNTPSVSGLQALVKNVNSMKTA